MSDFTDELEAPSKPKPFFLGVLGSRNDGTEEDYLHKVLFPMLEVMERTPEKVILPAEGTSTIWIQNWAESMKIPTETYQADWRRHQRRAKIFRDARIQQEGTKFLVFLNMRSEANEKIANRIAEHGREVFTVKYATWEMELLTPEETPCESLQSPRPKGHGRTRGTGTKRV
jgi:hypothetical protein